MLPLSWEATILRPAHKKDISVLILTFRDRSGLAASSITNTVIDAVIEATKSTFMIVPTRIETTASSRPGNVIGKRSPYLCVKISVCMRRLPVEVIFNSKL